MSAASPYLPIPPSPHPAVSSSRRLPIPLSLLLSVSVALLALAVRLPELGRYATIDESRWVGRSADFRTRIEQGDLDATFIVGHPGVTTMWLGALGMGPERVRAFASERGQPDVTQREGYLGALVAGRQATTVANAAMLGAIVWLAAGLLGLAPALVGGVLLALDPFVGAHMRLLHLDGLLASLMALAALSVLAFVRGDPSTPQAGWRWGYLALSGACTGLALLTKAPSVFLLAFVPGVLVLSVARGWLAGAGLRPGEGVGAGLRPAHVLRSRHAQGGSDGEQGGSDGEQGGSDGEQGGSQTRPYGDARGAEARTTFIALLIWGAVALLVVWALWPAFRLDPLGVTARLVQFARANGGSEHDNYFWGQPTEDPGPLLYPVAFLLRATPLVLLGLALAATFLQRALRSEFQVSSFKSTSRRDSEPGSRDSGPGTQNAVRGTRNLKLETRNSKLEPVVWLALYALGFWLLVTLANKKFDRYLLPAYPALLLLAGWGLWQGFRALFGRQGAANGPRAAPMLSACAGLVLAVWPLVSVWPYPLAYYNPLAGGGPFARWALIVGWGEGLDQVADYLNRQPVVLNAPVVASSYHRVLQAHLVGTAMPLERAELAEYVVPYVNTLQRGADLATWQAAVGQGAPEHVVWVNGIEYVRVYRGPRAPAERPGGARLGPLVLDGYTFAPGSAQLRPNDEVALRLRWRADGPPPGGTLAVLLLGPDGAPVATDRKPLAGALREGPLLVVDSRLRAPRAGVMELAVRLEDERGGAVAGPLRLEGFVVR